MRSLPVAATAATAASLVLITAAPASAAPVNQPPVVVDDAVAYRDVDQDHVVPALANDSDPDGDTLTFVSVTQATRGTAHLQDGELLYRPALGDTGADSFTYTVADGHGNTATGTVAVTLWHDLAPPADLTISSSTPGTATLDWPAVDGAVSYQISRNGQTVGSTTALTWTDSGLSDSQQYEYRISAVNGGDYAGQGSTSAFRRQQFPSPPDVTVAATDDPTALEITWGSPGAAGPWRVYRDGVPLADTPFYDFRDVGLVTGRAYSYQVQRLGPASPPHEVYVPSTPSASVMATPVQLTDIGLLVYRWGGDNSALGPVTVPERVVPGGRQQDHRNGLVVQQDGGRPIAVTNDFATAYSAAGGASGDLGFPLADLACPFFDGGCWQSFVGGGIWRSPSTAVRVVRTIMVAGWSAAGGQQGPLGYPVADQVALRGGVGQAFQGGAVYWTAVTGSHGVSGPIRDRWAAAGSENGTLGWPTSDEVHLVGGGSRQSFQGGTITWSQAAGTRVVPGTVRDAWTRQGWETGTLGSPTSEAIPLRGGVYQLFQGGSVYWSPGTGAHTVLGAIRDAWARQGWETGRLGYPTTDEIPLRGGAYQLYQGGSIYWSPTTGAHVVLGAIRDTWARQGWETGHLGYPTTDERPLRGGAFQVFQGGSIYWSPTTGAHAVVGAIRDYWGQHNWEAGRLGYPTSEEMPLRGGAYQLFQGGSMYWSPGTGAHAVVGAIRDAWARQGWETGRLGYPTADEVVSGGVARQTFQGGSITFDLRTGRVTYR